MRYETRRAYAVRITAYALMIVLALALQNALPPAAHVRPQLLIVTVAVAAMFHGPHTGGTVGFFCGLLADWLSVHTVVFHTVVLMLIGALFGLIADYSLRKTLPSAYFAAVITLAVTRLLYVAVFILARGRAGLGVLISVTVPEILYSLALLPLFYFPARAVYRMKKRKG